MRKTVFFVSFLCVSFLATQVSAQTSSFKNGDNVIGLGLGLGSSYYYSGLFNDNYSRTPTFIAMYEHCIIGKVFNDQSSIGVGGMFGYFSETWKNSYYKEGWSHKYQNFYFGARGAFHYAFVNNLDTYAGFVLGYQQINHKYANDYSSTESSNSGLRHDLFAGARYYFNSNFGVFGELGYGISYLRLGLAIRF